MNDDGLAVQARSALDSGSLECVGDWLIIGHDMISAKSDFPFRFDGATSTPDVTACRFIGGRWDKVPNQRLDVVAHSFHIPISEPGLYALLRPKQACGPPALSPLHPSPAETAVASEAAEALAPISRALTDLLAPRPSELSRAQIQTVEALLKTQRFAPVALLNRYGVVVWHRESRLRGTRVDDAPDGESLKTHAMMMAYIGRKTAACAMSRRGFEIGFPLATDWVVGVLMLHCEPA